MIQFKVGIVTVIVLLSVLLGGCKKERYINKPGFLVNRTVDQDSSLPSIFINGTQLHAEAFGPADSALIIILHGGPGADYSYLLKCKAFADYGYRVVFYDQRGAGLSKRYPKSTYTSLQIMYDDLTAVIAKYRTSPSQKVFLLGHSWGAMLASAYINQYPNSIDGAILGEPGGLKWSDVLDYLSRSRSYPYTSEAANDATYVDQFITGKEDEHEILDYKLDLLSAAENTKGSPVGNEGPLPHFRSGAVTFYALIELGNTQKPDFTTHLQQYTTPVLFLYSENNTAYGKAHAEKVSSAYPNVQLFKVNGAGHDMLSFSTGWDNFFPIGLQYLNALK